MRQAVVTLEIKDDGESGGTVRWERTDRGPGKTFELLGRAFEVAQRESSEEFTEALQAFFRGALLRKEDVAAVLEGME